MADRDDALAALEEGGREWAAVLATARPLIEKLLPEEDGFWQVVIECSRDGDAILVGSAWAVQRRKPDV